jgi:hypothetical protein
LVALRVAVRSTYLRSRSSADRPPEERRANMPEPPGKAWFDWRTFINAAAAVFLRVLGQAALYWLTGKGGHR